ncbi:MAG: hypothetical protein RR348_05895, partial [Clostridia bacterium]
GCFIDTPEVNAIVQQVKERNEAIFDESITDEIMKAPEAEVDVMDKKISFLPDDRCVEVLEYCLRNRNVTITGFQRGLGFGFPRAAKIYDWLNEMNYVKVEGNVKTFILTEEQVEQIKQREIDANDPNSQGFN